jgi:hypothetical protein
MHNREKTYMRVSIGVALISTVLIFLPGLLQIDGMKGGYAISFVAFFIAVCGVVIALFFRGRAASLDRLMQGGKILAHWTYPPDQWQDYTEVELKDQKENNKVLFLITAGWAVLFGVLFLIFGGEAGRVVLLVMVGLILVLAVFAFGMPRRWYRRQKDRFGEVWIGEDGVYFQDAFTQWNHGGARLDKVEIIDKPTGAPMRLGFEISFPSRMGVQDQTLRIPIPRGREAEAQAVVEHFNQSAEG